MNKPAQPMKVALVTGAARRIGAVIACFLHAQGMNVIVHYRKAQQEAQALVDHLNEQRANSAVTLQADLHDTAKIPDLIAQAVASWGQLDALINNASSFYPTSVATAKEKDWEELLGSNLKSPFFLAQAAAPFLAAQQGAIVNITDINSQRPRKDYSIYCAAKAGLHMLTKSLAQELAPAVRVNAVAPGRILCPEHEPLPNTPSLEKLLENIPLQRTGTPDDVAQAVWYLLQARYVTGQMIAVDGGLSL